jgi:hypothetical protein
MSQRERYMTKSNSLASAALKAPKAPPEGRFSLTDAGRFSWERNDCSVRAMAAATGRSYDACHATLKDAGREDLGGCRAAVLSQALALPFVTTGREAQARGFPDTRPTAAKFIRENPTGTYIVFVTGHFFALVNGVQLDMGMGLYKPRRRCWGYWKISD